MQSTQLQSPLSRTHQMNRLIRLPLRHFLVFSFLFFSGKVFSQANCSCPALTSCAPCSGGISTLILKYNGPGGFMIVTDFPYISPPQYISNGQIVPISGTRSDGRFYTSQINISIDLNSNAFITVSCALDFDPNARRVTLRLSVPSVTVNRFAVTQVLM